MNWEVGISLLNVFDRRNVWYRQFNFSADNLQADQWRAPTVRDFTSLGFTPMVNVGVTLH